MDLQPTPSFDEWVEYCFTKGDADFKFPCDSRDYKEVENRIQKYCSFDPIVLTTYLTKLFKSPGFIIKRFTADQIARATWFIFGLGSEYFHDVCSDAVPIKLQVDCIRSVTTMYTDLYDKLCCQFGTDPDSDRSDAIDVAVVMIWDMDSFDGPVMYSSEKLHLRDNGFKVLKTVLEKCYTSTCLESALHGLGHVQHKNPELVVQIIDGFLSSRKIPKWLLEYAMHAKTGSVI